MSLCRGQALDKSLGGDKDTVPEQGPGSLVPSVGWVGTLASAVGLALTAWRHRGRGEQVGRSVSVVS